MPTVPSRFNPEGTESLSPRPCLLMNHPTWKGIVWTGKSPSDPLTTPTEFRWWDHDARDTGILMAAISSLALASQVAGCTSGTGHNESWQYGFEHAHDWGAKSWPGTACRLSLHATTLAAGARNTAEP